MALDLRLQQKMMQQLVMTPQLQQAIKLLQLSHMEMAQALQKEMEENPVLEEPSDNGDERGDGTGEPAGEPEVAEGTTASDAEGAGESASTSPSEEDLQFVGDAISALDAPNDATPEPSSHDVDREVDWEAYLESYSYSLPASAGSGSGSEDLPPFEANLTRAQSLHEFLRWQVQMGEFSEVERNIAAMLIEEIDDDGYLPADVVETVAAELEYSPDAVSTVVHELQTLDPLGVAARDLRECLLIQAEQHCYEDPLILAIIDRHLPNVERRNYQAIAKDLKVSIQEVGAAVRLLGQLEPRPGRAYNDKDPQYITPDIYVHKVGDDYVIVLNEDGLPKLRVSGYYRNALQSSAGNTKSYIQERLRSAVWLIRSIHMRQRTIYRVMESILKFQLDFFDRGVTHLKPLILKDIAEDIGMHESTISRVTSNKYVHTPRGIFELKYFFNSSIARIGGDSIASESVRNHIETLIGSESPRSPLSDQRVVELLKQQGIDIARRTVAKYREMLKIPSSSKRKQVLP